jgi:hypothetical protein
VVLEYRATGSKYLVYNLGGTVPAGWDNQDTTSHTGPTSSYGFKRTGSGNWSDTGSGNVQTNKSYFFLLPAASNPGSKVVLNGTGTEEAPTVMTIISTTSIDMTGNFVMKPKLKGLTVANQPPWAVVDLSFLAGMDIKINGGAASNTIDEEGIIYAHEQIDAQGNGTVKGQIIAYDRSLVNASLANTPGSIVSINRVLGSFNLVHEVGNGYLGGFGIATWRQLREFRSSDAR